MVTANRVQQSDQAYWSQSSSTISSSSDHVSSSESDPASDSDNRAGSPISSQASSTCGKIEEIQETLQKDLVVSVWSGWSKGWFRNHLFYFSLTIRL